MDNITPVDRILRSKTAMERVALRAFIAVLRPNEPHTPEFLERNLDRLSVRIEDPVMPRSEYQAVVAGLLKRRSFYLRRQAHSMPTTQKPESDPCCCAWLERVIASAIQRELGE